MQAFTNPYRSFLRNLIGRLSKPDAVLMYGAQNEISLPFIPNFRRLCLHGIVSTPIQS